MRSPSSLILAAALLAPIAPALGAADSAALAVAAARLVNVNARTVLPGNVHRLAKASALLAAPDPSLPMERMTLSLSLAPEKQAALERLLAEQQDPASGNFHRWLTPEEFGSRFGRQPEEIAAVANWLAAEGFRLDEVAKGGTWINFSGTVAKVESAFRTRINDYLIGGRLRHANADEPSIPAALADLVDGVVSLHNIPKKAMGRRLDPAYNSGSSHYLVPGDFATIYNLNPLYAAGIDGSGQTIAIVGRTHPSSSNWATFRSLRGLPANPPIVVVNGTDPGDLGADEDGEADLDVEWSGAVATNATIKFVVSTTTNSMDGVDLSAQYIVNNNLAPVMSLSFGSCESDLGASGRSFYNNLWSQAVAQGITVVVSSGDSGAAGCDDPSATTSSTGLAVSGLASTPYNVAVGGTQFNEGSGNYWSSSNGVGGASALSYIPEVVWNESGSVAGGSGLWASSGGVSQYYSKPSWQTGLGVPADGKRDIPDVALSSAGHDGYWTYSQGAVGIFSGTSAAAPAFAGIMALVVQKTGQRQGNANPRLYQLASAQYQSGGSAVFHDVSSGNNGVPGRNGYSAGAGYDLATGLGSVDANALVNNWAGGASACSYSLGSRSLSVGAGAATGNVSLTTSSGCTWTAVSNASWLSVSAGSASGSGSGSVFYAVTANTGSAARTGTLTIGGQSFTVTQASVGCSLAIAPSGQSVAVAGGSGTVSVTTSSGCTWTATSNAVWITVNSGASGSGSGTVAFTVAANTAVAARSGTMTIAGQTFTVTQAGSSCSFALSSTSQTATATGLSGTVTVTSSVGCAWTALSAAAWISVTSGASASGTGVVAYSVGANTSSSARTGTLTIAGQTFTVTQAGVGGGSTTTQVLQNPGFESGATIWTQTSTNGYSVITNDPSYASHAGSYYAWLGGYDSGTDTIKQTVTIPAGSQTALLQFWYWIDSAEVSISSAYDTMTVALYNATSGARLTTLKVYSNLDASAGWVQSPQYDLSTYAGQSVSLRFVATTDGSNPTSFLVDDVTLSTTGTPVTPTLPSAPTAVSAVAGIGSATVSFIPGSLGTGTLVGYFAGCGVDSLHLLLASGTISPITVTGLVNGSSYQCWVETRSSVGDSAWSQPSNSVSPLVTNYALAVTKRGTGSGTVTSSPAGINCGTACSGSFTSSTSVALTATPNAGSTFTGWGGACVGTAVCNVTMGSAQNVTANFVPTVLSFSAGWNMAGNGVDAPITVATTFADAGKVYSVWKWVVSGSAAGISYPTWAYYAPSQSDGGSAYAAGKGYELLTTIRAGEGFWLNAKSDFTAALPTAAALQSSTFLPAIDTPPTAGGVHALPHGWSLMATGDGPTAAQFDAAIATVQAVTPAAGKVYTNLTAIWSWDATRQRWYFWAPAMVNDGSLASYLSSKGYLDFSTMPGSAIGTLPPTAGFWVNMP